MIDRREAVKACRTAGHELTFDTAALSKRHDIVRAKCPTCDLLVADDVIEMSDDTKRADAIAEFKQRFARN